MALNEMRSRSKKPQDQERVEQVKKYYRNNTFLNFDKATLTRNEVTNLLSERTKSMIDDFETFLDVQRHESNMYINGASNYSENSFIHDIMSKMNKMSLRKQMQFMEKANKLLREGGIKGDPYSWRAVKYSEFG